jgi:hypothetical protein
MRRSVIVGGTIALAVAWQAWIQLAFGDRHCVLEDCDVPTALMLLSLLVLPVLVGLLLAVIRDYRSLRVRLTGAIASNGVTLLIFAVVLFVQWLGAPEYGGPWSGSPKDDLMVYTVATIVFGLPIAVLVGFALITVSSATMRRMIGNRIPSRPDERAMPAAPPERGAR